MSCGRLRARNCRPGRFRASGGLWIQFKKTIGGSFQGRNGGKSIWRKNMKSVSQRNARIAAFLILFAASARGEWTHGVVASGHPIATDTGLAVLKSGGNAVDAAVSVALTLGVVDGHNSGIGGGCFILIRRANGSLVAIDGREMAPAAARRDMFVRNGKPDTDLSQSGALASGGPGAIAA